MLNNWFYNSNVTTDDVYTDIAKAFDTVSHCKLLLVTVLRSYGIQCNVLKWIKSFLSNRLQKVCINNSFSDTLPVTSGVP